MDIFKEEKERWLTEARQTARELLRDKESVTIDDVIDLCPRPKYLHRNTNGAVFNRDFESVGFTKAVHPAAKGRWIQMWKLKGSVAAVPANG